MVWLDGTLRKASTRAPTSTKPINYFVCFVFNFWMTKKRNNRLYNDGFQRYNKTSTNNFYGFFRKLHSMQCKLKTFEILNTAKLLQYKQNRSISHQRRWCVRGKKTFDRTRQCFVVTTAIFFLFLERKRKPQTKRKSENHFVHETSEQCTHICQSYWDWDEKCTWCIIICNVYF